VLNNVLDLRKVGRSRVYEEIVRTIQKQIMTGAAAPGTRLPSERDLAESLAVNRATLREALRKLEDLELIEIRHGEGVFVKDFMESGNLDIIKTAVSIDEGNDTLLGVMEARIIIVPELAALAAKRRTDGHLVKLKQLIQEETDIIERDLEINLTIARASHNLAGIVILNSFKQLHRDFGRLYFDSRINVERSIKFHQDIYNAIKRQQPKAAYRIMREVLLYAENDVRAKFKMLVKP
jgi:GntR family transcriptional regulator, transcriptional repressor for pyruvate dehydrogenase complex